uniref:Cytochrome P450 n=1 Tax=Eutreptiella gymnastica TaxID=73025 RepID=A0A7S4FF29_9EUGL
MIVYMVTGVANAEAATSLSAATATSNARTAPRFSADARVRAVPPIAPGAIPEARPVAAPHTSRTTDASPSMTAAPARGPQALFAVLAAAAAAAAFAVWNRLRRPATPLSSQAIHVPLEECRIAMAATTGESSMSSALESLPVPPGPKQGPIRNLRDSISYLINPDRFIATRTDRYGPIFSTYLFFRPTVVVGGQPAVADFIAKEKKAKITRSTLPPTFEELHTAYGSLNMDSNGEEHQLLRRVFRDIFGPKAMEQYLPFVEEEMDVYVADLLERVKKDPEGPVYLVPELRTFSLNAFSKIFSEEGLTDEQVQLFDTYNTGLLALSKSAKPFVAAKEALATLVSDMRGRLDKYKARRDAPGSPQNLVLDAYIEAGCPDEQIATAMVLLIWGAYIETASLLVKSIVTMDRAGPEKEALISSILAESAEKEANWMQLRLTQGVVRESLRLNAPGGGGFRDSDIDFELAGYRIPAGTVVTADPRIGNRDASLFPEPEKFAPERWVPASGDATEPASKCPFAGSALNRGMGSWFPGGIGAHQCPGVPLAEAVGTMFLVKFLTAFKSWRTSGSGLTKAGDVKYVQVPIKIPVDDFGLVLQPRAQEGVSNGSGFAETRSPEALVTGA